MPCYCGCLECNCQTRCRCPQGTCVCISCYMIQGNRCQLCGLPTFHRSSSTPEGYCNCFLSESQILPGNIGTNNSEVNIHNGNHHDRADFRSNGCFLPTLTLEPRFDHPDTHCEWQENGTGEVSNRLDISDCESTEINREPVNDLPVISLEELVPDQILPQNQDVQNDREQEFIYGKHATHVGKHASGRRQLAASIGSFNESSRNLSPELSNLSISSNDSTRFRPLQLTSTNNRNGPDSGATTQEISASQPVNDSSKFARPIKNNSARGTVAKFQTITMADRLEAFKVLSNGKPVRLSIAPNENVHDPRYFVPTTRGPVFRMRQEFAPPPISTVVPPFNRKIIRGLPLAATPYMFPPVPIHRIPFGAQRPFLNSPSIVRQSPNRHPAQQSQPRHRRNPLFSVRGNIMDWINSMGEDYTMPHSNESFPEEAPPIRGLTIPNESNIDLENNIARARAEDVKSVTTYPASSSSNKEHEGMSEESIATCTGTSSSNKDVPEADKLTSVATLAATSGLSRNRERGDNELLEEVNVLTEPPAAQNMSVEDNLYYTENNDTETGNQPLSENEIRNSSSSS